MVSVKKKMTRIRAGVSKICLDKINFTIYYIHKNSMELLNSSNQKERDFVNERPAKFPQIASRVVDGESVIINLTTQESLVLNPVGSHIWGALDGRKTVGEIASLVASRFNISSEIALQDTVEFLTEIRQAGIIL